MFIKPHKNLNKSVLYSARGNLRIPRTKAKRDFLGLFERFTKTQSAPSGRPRIYESTQFSNKDHAFTFQVIGVGIITVAVVLVFQGFLQTESISLQAKEENQTVRLLTNFQFLSPELQNGESSRLKDFSVVQQPVEVSEEVLMLRQQQQEELQKERIIHVVEEGENIYTISALYSLNPKDIITKNNLVPPYTIDIGQELVI